VEEATSEVHAGHSAEIGLEAYPEFTQKL